MEKSTRKQEATSVYERKKLQKKVKDASFIQESRRTQNDAAAVQEHVFRRVNSDVLNAIEKRHGQHITHERMQKARDLPASVLPRGEYQALLQSVYGVDKDQAKRMLGHYDRQNGQIWVSKTHPLTMRLLAHEHLHQLEHPQTRELLGKGLEEGMTEWLARDSVGDPNFADQPRVYPQEIRIVNMLNGLAGQEAIEKAYFQGDLQELRRGVDQRLGEGALAKIAHLTERKRYEEAQEFIKTNYERR